MPFHENEHAGKGACGAPEYGAGDHIGRATAQKSRGANPPNARAEPIAVGDGSPRRAVERKRSAVPPARGRAGSSHLPLVTWPFSLFTSAAMRGPTLWLMLVV